MIVTLQSPSETLFREISFNKHSFLKLINSFRGKSCRLIILLKQLNKKDEVLFIEESIDKYDNETLVKKLFDRTKFIINNNESSMKVEMPSLEEIKAHLKEMK